MQFQPFFPQLVPVLAGIRTHYSWVGWSNVSEKSCLGKLTTANDIIWGLDQDHRPRLTLLLRRFCLTSVGIEGSLS